MPKPTDLPVWATDANYPAGADPWAETATKVEPLAGEQAAGHAPDQKPPAQYMNWWMHLVYLWIAYVDAGEWDGDLHVTGDLTVDGTVFTDTIDPPGGTLDVLGHLVAGGNIEAAGGHVFSGGTEKTPLCTSIARDLLGVHTVGAEQIIFAASAGKVKIPIIGLPVGDPVGAYLLGYRVMWAKNTDDMAEVNFDLVRNTNAGADDYLADTNLSNADDAPGAMDDEVIGFEHYMEPGYQYFLLIAPSGSITPAADRFYHAEIYWARLGS